MGKLSNKERRLRIFRYGSKAIAKYLNGDSSQYYCPICGVGYPESSAISGDDLTLEDVPPESIGGKPILLTCRKCNSRAGHTMDFATASKRKLEDSARIVLGQEKGKIPSAKLSFDQINIAVTIISGDSFDIKPIENANAPDTIERYKEHLSNILKNGSGEYEFKLSINEKYNHRLFKLSHLKSAFLVVFAWLGYRYAFDPRLEIVRLQIQEPENDILGTRFWIEGDGNTPLNTVMFLDNPVPFFLVSFDGFSIVLPSMESTGDIFNALSRYWEKGQRITLEAKVLLDSFPNNLQMKLDYLK